MKNNYVPKEHKDFLIDPDSEVYYEGNFVRVDQTKGNSGNKRMTFKTTMSHTIFMAIMKEYGLEPSWQKWESDIDASTGKAIPGKGKWVRVN